MATNDDQDRVLEDLMVEHASCHAVPLPRTGGLLCSFDCGARTVVLDRDGEVVADETRGDVLREGAWA